MTWGIVMNPFQAADAQTTWQQPPEPIASQLDAPRNPITYFSPDNRWMLHVERPPRPAIADLTEPVVRIAGIEFNPQTRGPARSYAAVRGMSIQRMGESHQQAVELPGEARIRHLSWSADSRSLAFTLTQPDGLELWVLNLEDGTPRRLTEPILNGVYGSPCDWLPGDAGLVCKVVPAEQSPPPEPPPVPGGPRIEVNQGREAPARTFTNLLTSPYDETLFEYHLTSVLEHITLEGDRRPLTSPMLIHWATPSPDGSAILLSTVQRPFSYQVPVRRFPRTIEVIDLSGGAIQTIAQLPLADDIPTALGSVRPGRRYVNWRSDRPATLYWVEALDGGDARQQVPYRDAVYQLDLLDDIDADSSSDPRVFPKPWGLNPAYPSDIEPQLLWQSELRFNNILWGTANTAIAYEYWHNTRQLRTWKLNPDTPSQEPILLHERDRQDAYSDPGYPVTAPGPYGWYTLLMADAIERDGAAGDEMESNGVESAPVEDGGPGHRHTIFLNGRGASPNGIFPFLDRWTLETGEKTRLWQAEAPYYERIERVLDPQAQRFITGRQSRHDPVNYWLYGAIAPNAATNSPANSPTNSATSPIMLTHRRDTLPWYADMHREIITYPRADGLDLSATLYLPPGYRPGVDEPLPTLMWVYPQEYKSREAAGQRTQAENVFRRPGGPSPLFLLSQGYAILMNPRMPIIGEGDTEPNDTYIDQLIMSAQAAVDHVVQEGISDPNRIAIGGHSYGAFTAANLLAHSNLFCAGIARNGAYNRTLTPFGFQGEQRNFWDARETYLQMSPFTYAMNINEPLLLIHGADDQNSGTYPIQSERLYEAMRGLGGTVRWVELPLEGHSYVSREAVGHVLWEMLNWLEQC